MNNVSWLEAGASLSRHFKLFLEARKEIKKSLSLWSVRDKAFIINSSRTGGLLVRAVFCAGGFLVKPRQTPGGMIHFWGDFSLSFSAHHGGAISQPGFTPAFAGIFVSARAGFFILRELAEFG